MSTKISALIFSINEYDLVHPKIKLLYPYVDEIVIIDSSTDKEQKRLMKSLEKKYKKVRMIWLPPLGVAELYYKIGINECRYDWIFQLDADDIPSKKLVEDLRKLVNDKYDAYKIHRDVEDIPIFRLYRKDVASPFCHIGYLMIIKGRNYLELPSDKYIIYSSTGLKGYKTKIKRYAIIESFQQFSKLYLARYFYRIYSPPKFFIQTYFISKILHKFKKSYLLSIIIWLLYYIMLFFYYSLYGVRHLNSVGNSRGVLLSLYILRYFLTSPYIRFLSIHFEKITDFCSFMSLDDKYKFLRVSKVLKFGPNSLENFTRLYKYKLIKLIVKKEMIY